MKKKNVQEELSVTMKEKEKLGQYKANWSKMKRFLYFIMAIMQLSVRKWRAARGPRCCGIVWGNGLRVGLPIKQGRRGRWWGAMGGATSISCHMCLLYCACAGPHHTSPPLSRLLHPNFYFLLINQSWLERGAGKASFACVRLPYPRHMSWMPMS